MFQKYKMGLEIFIATMIKPIMELFYFLFEIFFFPLEIDF
jgi:hypothetical protein